MNSRSEIALPAPASVTAPTSRELPASPSDSAFTDTAEIFGLLADAGRLRLLVELRAGEAPVGELARAARLSESGASHALRLLRAHRVVQARRDGRMVRYRLADEHVRQLLDVALAHAEHSTLVHPELTLGQDASS
jgi:DNA-binding transcriptional ArsR family regulator